MAAINAALSNTQFPTMSADILDEDEEMEDDAMSKRLMRRRSKFRTDTSKMNKLEVQDVPHYSGFLVYERKDEPEEVTILIRLNRLKTIFYINK